MEEEFFTEDAKNVFARIMQFIEGGSTKTLPRPAPVHVKGTSPTKAVSSKSFNSKTLARMDARVARRNRQVSKEVQKKLQNEESSCSYKPQINSYSKRLARGELPLHQRIDQILESKKEHMATLKTLYKSRDEEERSELTFQPRLSSKGPQKHRSFDAVYKDLSSWHKQRTEKHKELRTLKQNQGIIEPKPQINKQSAEMTRSIESFEARLQQSVDQWQKRKSEKPPTHSFSPAITERAKALKLEQRVFERLSEKPLVTKFYSEFSRDQLLNLLSDI